MAPNGEIQPSAAVLRLPVGDAAEMGVDLEPLEAAAQRLRDQVDAGRLPGFLSCAVKDGRLVHFDAYGSADLCAGKPLRGDTLFRLYSQTKPVTVVGFMRLLERGLVCLDDPLSKYIPSFAKVTVGDKQRPFARQILLRDLLGHTSGVGFGPGFGYAPENDYEKTYVDVVRRVDSGEVRSLADWCDEVARLPLRFQPGKDWGYGYSSDLLGRVVEVVAGRPLDQYLQAEVIEPLGMHDTSFAVPPEKAGRLAALYSREPWDGSGKSVRYVTVDPGGSGLVADEAGRVQSHPSDGNGLPAPSASLFLRGRASSVIQGGGCVCSVAGGLVSTMGDYARFGQMLLNEGVFGGVQILRPESVKLLARDWLNDFSVDRRKRPLWVWDTPGIGFSPLGQIGVEHADVKGRRLVGAALNTVHWGGAGGSGYMLNWPHRLLVLTYTGCTYDTATQKAMWRAAFGSLRRGEAKPLKPLPPSQADVDVGVSLSDCHTPSKKRLRGDGATAAEEAAEACTPGSSKKGTPGSAKRRRPAAASTNGVCIGPGAALKS